MSGLLWSAHHSVEATLPGLGFDQCGMIEVTKVDTEPEKYVLVGTVSTKGTQLT